MRKKSRLALSIAGGLEAPITPWAGVAPLIETMRQTEVTGKAEKVLPLKKSSKGLTSGQMLECFVLLSALGGECLEDMERLRQDEALSQMLGYAIPAPETARQWLDRFHSVEAGKGNERQGLLLPGESGPLAGLAEVSCHVVRAYVQNVKVEKRVTLDIDAHLVGTDKAQARCCYQGYKAFQPIEVCWAEAGLVLADEFREGNVPAAEGNRRLIDEACEALGPGDWEVYIRSDSAAYDQENLDHWNSRGWKFAVSADMSPALKEAVSSMPPQSWRMIDEKGGVIKEWAEVPYVPSRRLEKKDSQPYRYVGVRLRRQQGELFIDGNSVRYLAVVSNIWEMPGQALLRWHRAKAGTIEHVHHVLKSGLGAGVYPSGKHGANAAWLRIQVITHNLLELLKSAVLPPEYATAEPKRLRFAVFTAMGQVVRHAHRALLKIANRIWAALIRAAAERAMELSPPPA